MKNNLFKLAGLMISAMLLGACSQLATFENEDLLSNQEAAAKNGFNLTPFGTGNENARTYAATDCGNFCIDPDLPEYSVQSAQISNNTGGGRPFTRVFTYTVYNTLNGFELGWSYTATNPGSRKLRITVSGAGFTLPQIYTSSAVQTTGNNTHTFSFTDNSWAACGVVTIKAEILDGGNDTVVSGPLTTYYSLIGACEDDCDEESFDYSSSVVGGLVDVTFQYNYSEEAEVSIDFTFPQIINDIPTNGSYTGADGKTYRVTGNGTVFHWTGDVSCSSESPTTFAFKGLVPDCGPSTAKDGKANIWTGAKVVAIDGVELVDDPETLDINEGEYSLKGDLDDIVYSGCPITKP
jgi:hypothetical protein